MAQFNTFRSNIALSRGQIFRHAPSVFATDPHESRSTRYRPVATVEILDALANEGFFPFSVAQQRVRDAGRREYAKHMLRMRHVTNEPCGFAANDGGTVPEIILVNSFDGSSSFQLIAGMFRFVCANGLMIGDTTAEVRIPHSGRIVDQAVDGTYKIAASFDAVLGVKDQLQSVLMPADVRMEFALQAAKIRFGNATDGWDRDATFMMQRSLLRYRRTEDAANDAWSVFNRVQENLMKGGSMLPGTGRRARRIEAIDSDLSVNRKLWNAAADLTGIKLAA